MTQRMPAQVEAEEVCRSPAQPALYSSIPLMS